MREIVLTIMLILFLYDGVVGKKVEPCNYSTDCRSNECCVSNTRPKGRRKRSVLPTGTCRTMGSNGAACLVNNEQMDITGSFFVSCPCATPLNCNPDGNRDMPLGPTGVCG